ncbi:hypothetical protein diail_10528 [Diaporthe ilicicola]|nr:hypothetical protein diail_10528 [Diaporthe ilicicola]
MSRADDSPRFRPLGICVLGKATPSGRRCLASIRELGPPKLGVSWLEHTDHHVVSTIGLRLDLALLLFLSPGLFAIRTAMLAAPSPSRILLAMGLHGGSTADLAGAISDLGGGLDAAYDEGVTVASSAPAIAVVHVAQKERPAKTLVRVGIGNRDCFNIGSHPRGPGQLFIQPKALLLYRAERTSF